jgi:hypothetical protein
VVIAQDVMLAFGSDQVFSESLPLVFILVAYTLIQPFRKLFLI